MTFMQVAALFLLCRERNGRTQQIGGKIFKLVFAGDVPFVPRVGDKVGILEGYAVHRVEDIYYSIPENTVEIYTACIDHANEYPEVEYPND